VRRAKTITVAVFVLLVLGLLILFYVQNQDTRVVLYLDLLVAPPMKLSQPTSVPMLMLASFGAGVAVMGIYTVIEIVRREGRHRRSRQDRTIVADQLRADKQRDNRGFDDYDSDF
jgi:uncharacterized integral membrane protein